MRWRPFTLCVLCLLWIPALWAWAYEPRWSYELSLLPGFPDSLAIPLAIGKSAAVVLPFAIFYFCLRLDREFSDERMTFLQGAAYVCSGAVILAAIACILFAPAITNALVV